MRAETLGGIASSKADRDMFSGLFADADFEGTLEAAFLLKQTGIALASWTRDQVPREVISVMAATMWGSLDTMVRTLGGEGPRSALLEIEGRRILAMQVEPNWTLLLIAPRTVGKRRLRHEAQRIVERLSKVRGSAVAKRTAAPVKG